MPAIEQDRRSAVRRGELKPARGGLVGRLHFGDDAGERAVAHAVLGKGKNVDVLAALRIEECVGAKPDLLQARRVEIEPGQRP